MKLVLVALSPVYRVGLHVLATALLCSQLDGRVWRGGGTVVVLETRARKTVCARQLAELDASGCLS
jgi:hypothetical protein